MDWYQTIKDFAGPLASVIAAAAAAFVAYRLGQNQITVAKSQADIAERNWRTQNEKVVLELMERRLAIYKGIRDVIGEVVRGGKATEELQYRYLQAIDQVPYLFGPEVEAFLGEFRTQFLDLELGNGMMAQPTLDYQKGAEIRHKAFMAISRFYERAKPIFGPYIRAHQRADSMTSGED